MIVPMAFLIVGIATLSDYGINWDEYKHFGRGQAYLHYVLTGHRNYLNIPRYPLLKGSADSKLNQEAPKSTIPPEISYRRSYFQSDLYTLDFLLKNEKNIPDLHDHPEGNDFLAAVFNNIFYQKLNVPILKIWKNNLANTRESHKSTMIYTPATIKKEDGHKIIFDMGERLNITKIEAEYPINCNLNTGRYIFLSNNNEDWIRLPGKTNGYQMRIDPVKFGFSENAFNYFIAGKKAQYILIDTLAPNSCLFESKNIKIFGLNKPNQVY